MTKHGKQGLEQENAELRKALWEQWRANHIEHCRYEWPHDGVCHWPVPDVLNRGVVVPTSEDGE
jgi:hypothetical protein